MQRRLRSFCLALCLTLPLSALAQEDHPLAGQTFDMTILGIGGWLPSSLGVEMAQELFAPYAQENFGYSVNFSFSEAPFSQLFQKAAASLATRSNEFNIIIATASGWARSPSRAGSST